MAAQQVARVLVYEGPFGPTLRILKRVSVFSCGCTLVGVPLLTAFGNEEMDVVQRVAVGFTVCTFAVGTTAALTWVSKPYIWRMYRVVQHADAAMIKPSAGWASGPLEIESFNLLGRLKTTRLPNGLADLESCEQRIFANAGTKLGPAFYVHEEPDCYAEYDLYVEIMKRIGLKPAPDIDTSAKQSN